MPISLVREKMTAIVTFIMPIPPAIIAIRPKNNIFFKSASASFTRILSSVIIPVSKAGIATIVIFTAVSYWNRYFDALMYITKQRLKPAALLLYEFIKLSTMEEGMGEPELAALVSPDIKNASIVVLTVIPILAIYPFMQRYFVKGVMVGSVKG